MESVDDDIKHRLLLFSCLCSIVKTRKILQCVNY